MRGYNEKAAQQFTSVRKQCMQCFGCGFFIDCVFQPLDMYMYLQVGGWSVLILVVCALAVEFGLSWLRCVALC